MHDTVTMKSRQIHIIKGTNTLVRSNWTNQVQHANNGEIENKYNIANCHISTGNTKSDGHIFGYGIGAWVTVVHPCESKIAPALNFYAYFLRLILFFFSFLHIKLVLGF